MSLAGEEERPTFEHSAHCKKEGCHMDDQDPTYTDPDKYKTIFENERVRVLD